MKKKIIFSLSDIMTAYETANKEKNTAIAQKLRTLFITADGEVAIAENSEVAAYLISQKICLESIIFSYAKALYKNNSSVKNKLKKFLFQFMENIENGIETTYLIEMIKADEELFQYISNTTTIEELKKDLNKKKKKNVVVSKKNNQLIKGKPFIN